MRPGNCGRHRRATSRHSWSDVPPAEVRSNRLPARLLCFICNTLLVGAGLSFRGFRRYNHAQNRCCTHFWRSQQVWQEGPVRCSRNIIEWDLPLPENIGRKRLTVRRSVSCSEFQKDTWTEAIVVESDQGCTHRMSCNPAAGRQVGSCLAA